MCFPWSRIPHCIWFSCLFSLFSLWQFLSFSLAIMTLRLLKSSYQVFGSMTLEFLSAGVFLIRLNSYMKLSCLITDDISLDYLIISLYSYYFSFVMGKYLEEILWEYANILFLKLLFTNFNSPWWILPAKVIIVVSSFSFPSWVTLADYLSYLNLSTEAQVFSCQIMTGKGKY